MMWDHLQTEARFLLEKLMKRLKLLLSIPKLYKAVKSQLDSRLRLGNNGSLPSLKHFNKPNNLSLITHVNTHLFKKKKKSILLKFKLSSSHGGIQTVSMVLNSD